jgi:hypothetical protein
MNGRPKMQGGKNWILPKEINANWFFREIWKNHNLRPSKWEGAWLWTLIRIHGVFIDG